MNTEEPSDSLDFVAIINTMGHAVLIETIRMAAFYVAHSDSTHNSKTWNLKIREAKSCYAYVTGTGLEIIVDKFGLEYNPDRLRNDFRYCIRKSA